MVDLRVSALLRADDVVLLDTSDRGFLKAELWISCFMFRLTCGHEV